MFHLLRPVYDVNVFALLNRDLDAVPSTHSCAQHKPWCGRCAKCIYVWMNYVAWLPAETVAACFEANLFDVPENRQLLRKMLGLESYKPTDCVGTVSEARLAFAMCRAKGVGGRHRRRHRRRPDAGRGSGHARPLRAGPPSGTHLSATPGRADRRPVPSSRPIGRVRWRSMSCGHWCGDQSALSSERSSLDAVSTLRSGTRCAGGGRRRRAGGCRTGCRSTAVTGSSTGRRGPARSLPTRRSAAVRCLRRGRRWRGPPPSRRRAAVRAAPRTA